MKKVFLNEMSALEVKAMLEHAEDVTAITCFGSCESHGWHCCLGPDFFVPTEVAKRVAEKLEKFFKISETFSSLPPTTDM